MTTPGPARVLAVSILIVTLATQPVFLLAAAVGQAGPELGFDSVGLGALTTAFFLAAALTSAPAGRLVERIGWQTSMRLTAAVAIVTLLLIASVGRSLPAIAGFLIVGAAAYGFANPAANAALARHAHPGREGTFFGLKHAGIPGSALLAGLAVPIINLRYGWRWSYVAAACLVVVLLALIPRSDGVRGSLVGQAARPVAEMRPIDLRRLAVVASLAALAPGALGTFTVAGGLDAGLSEAAAGWTLAIGGLASIVARASLGAVVDRVTMRPVRLLFVVVASGSLVLGFVAFASGGLYAPMVVLAFMVAWGWPGLLTYTVVEGNLTRPAASSAVTQAGVFVGAAIGPPVFGLLVDGPGFRSAWLLTAVGLAAAATVLRPVVSRSAAESV